MPNARKAKASNANTRRSVPKRNGFGTVYQSQSRAFFEDEPRALIDGSGQSALTGGILRLSSQVRRT